MTQVKLLGELGDKFGTDWQCAGKSMRDILKLIDCQTDGFREYFAECHAKNIGFTIQNGEDFIEEDAEMWLPTLKDTVIISPVPAGSGKGLGKILAAILMITAVVMTGGAAAGAVGGTGTVGAVSGNTLAAMQAGTAVSGIGTGTLTATSSFGIGGLNLGTVTSISVEGAAAVTSYSLSTAGYMLIAMGANLGIMGITEMSAPDAGDMTSDPSYLFNGADNNIEQGQPVPVLYGTMKIGGTSISQGFQTGELRGAKFDYASGSISSYYYGGSTGTGAIGGTGWINSGKGALLIK